MSCRSVTWHWQDISQVIFLHRNLADMSLSENFLNTFLIIARIKICSHFLLSLSLLLLACHRYTPNFIANHLLTYLFGVCVCVCVCMIETGHRATRTPACDWACTKLRQCPNCRQALCRSWHQTKDRRAVQWLGWPHETVGQSSKPPRSFPGKTQGNIWMQIIFTVIFELKDSSWSLTSVRSALSS